MRNARGGRLPDPVAAAAVCVGAGCQGITVHPRPDARHIRADDVHRLAGWLSDRAPGIEFNIEGNPFAPARPGYPGLLVLVEAVRPAQCTLVPDADGQLTSDHGFALPGQLTALAPLVDRLRSMGTRVSIFVDAGCTALAEAAAIGVDRVEIYTGPFAEAVAGATPARPWPPAGAPPTPPWRPASASTPGTTSTRTTSACCWRRCRRSPRCRSAMPCSHRPCTPAWTPPSAPTWLPSAGPPAGPFAERRRRRRSPDRQLHFGAGRQRAGAGQGLRFAAAAGPALDLPAAGPDRRRTGDRKGTGGSCPGAPTRVQRPKPTRSIPALRTRTSTRATSW